MSEALVNPEKADAFTYIREARKTPRMLWNILLSVLRQAYFDLANLPRGVTQTWNPDVTKTKIWIDTEFRWEDEAPTFRPAIYIQLAPLKYEAITGVFSSPYSHIDIREAEYTRADTVTGGANLVHIANTGAETVELAGATLDYLKAFSDVIRTDFCFEQFKVLQHSSLQVAKENEARERYKAVIGILFSFQDVYTIKRESPKLKNVVIQSTVNY